MAKKKFLQFPEGFIWGTSTAAAQVETANPSGGFDNSDWAILWLLHSMSLHLTAPHAGQSMTSPKNNQNNISNVVEFCWVAGVGDTHPPTPLCPVGLTVQRFLNHPTNT